MSGDRRDPSRPRVGIALPGGFEFGGIGRVMMYATQAWSTQEDAPRWRLVDGRGAGPLSLMPLHLVKASAQVVAGGMLGRLDLLHLNVAGRGSTLRKLVLAEAAALVGLPTIVHLHDYDYGADLAKRPAWLRARIAAMFRRARRVIVLGRRDAELVERALAVPRERIVVLHNAVPDPGPPVPRGDATPMILFLGQLSERKGVPELLRALSTPSLQRRAWRLVAAGGGPEQARFTAQAAALGLTERVSFPGWLRQEATWALLREAAIFALPSHAEGQAMALLEAMANGLAIVTTPVGAHLEAVSDGVSALIVPPGDVESLAGALVALLDDAERRVELGQAARRTFAERFSVDTYARRLADIYRTALGPAGL